MGDPLNRYWRLPEVTNRTGLARSTIYRRIAAKQFPRPRDLGGDTVAWWADDVMAWMLARPITGIPGHETGHDGDAAPNPQEQSAA